MEKNLFLDFQNRDFDEVFKRKGAEKEREVWEGAENKRESRGRLYGSAENGRKFKVAL